jgi:excisionase family DNA binding protein
LTDDTLCVSVEEAARMLGIGRSLCWQEVRRGTIPSYRIGARVLVPLAELRRLVQARTQAAGAKEEREAAS